MPRLRTQQLPEGLQTVCAKSGVSISKYSIDRRQKGSRTKRQGRRTTMTNLSPFAYLSGSAGACT
eukprot:2961951-Amphidinium_carterae.1